MPAHARRDRQQILLVDPRPQFELSPYLFMQFMEPLGTTDPSLEAGWDFKRNRWRKDLVRVTRELAPGLIRWPGGILTAYYRWKEAVGREVADNRFTTCAGTVWRRTRWGRTSSLTSVGRSEPTP